MYRMGQGNGGIVISEKSQVTEHRNMRKETNGGGGLLNDKYLHVERM